MPQFAPSLMLAGYAVVIGVFAPRFLAHAGWTIRAPKLALVAWSCVIGGTILALVGSGMLASVPLLHVAGGLPELWHTCRYFGGALAQHLGLTAIAVIGTLASASLVVAVAKATLGQLRSSRRARRAHLSGLVLVAQPLPGWPRSDTESQVLVLPNHVPVAYCVPSAGGGTVVLSSTAMRLLDGPALKSVLAHEQAHLTGHHHMLVDVARRLAQCLPLPVTRRAAAAVPVLVELAADDVAMRATSRAALHRALQALGAAGAPGSADSTIPGVALHAAAASVGFRATRVSQSGVDAWSRRGWPMVLGIAGVAVGPPVLALVTTLASLLGTHFCPLPAI